MTIEFGRELRKTVGSLESVLRVNSPQVHMRLSGRPSSLVSVQSQPHLRQVFSNISQKYSVSSKTIADAKSPSSLTSRPPTLPPTCKTLFPRALGCKFQINFYIDCNLMLEMLVSVIASFFVMAYTPNPLFFSLTPLINDYDLFTHVTGVTTTTRTCRPVLNRRF